MSGLWCDRHGPTSLSKLDFHEEEADNLRKLVKSNDFPNLLIYGPSGAGKKTRIHCILKELFGAGVDRLRIEHQTVETPSKKKIEVRTVASNYHIEVNPCDAGFYDRVVIQELIKIHAQTLSLSEKIPFKVVVVTEADKLTKDAQHALRRTMEKYISSCRLILCAESSSRLTPAIKSRCLLVRVAAPSNDKIAHILTTIAKKEHFTVSPSIVAKIATASGRNLRRAILMLETMKVRGNEEVVQPQWYLFTQMMARKMLQKQNSRGLEEIRSDYFELQAHLIPPEIVFKVIVSELLPKCDDGMKLTLIKLAAHYEHQMRLGSKRVIHFEAFAAHFMSSYRQFLEGIFNDMDDNEDFFPM